MKKICILILAVLVSFSVFGCSQPAAEPPVPKFEETEPVSKPKTPAPEKIEADYSSEPEPVREQSDEPRFIECDACGGQGKFSCPSCDGTGDAVCTDCGGKGKVKCTSCGGSGRDDLSPFGGGCIVCGGTGWSTCFSCAYAMCIDCYGSGIQYCDKCGEKGKINNPNYHESPSEAGSALPYSNSSDISYYNTDNDYPSSIEADCPMCDKGERECSYCHGAGSTTETEYSIDLGSGSSSYNIEKRCRVCGGSGNMICGYCGGDGTL